MSTLMISMLFILVVIILVIAVIQSNKKKEQKEVHCETIPSPKKSIKLFKENGELILEYKDVYITYWDKNIYFLSKEYEGECFVRIDKGVNMLLVVVEKDDA